MPGIVVSEFMDAAAVAELRAAFQVLHDPGLVARPADLARAVADALIVRNRTQVRGSLLAAASRLRAVGRLGRNERVSLVRARNLRDALRRQASTSSIASTRSG